jgi:hypothetical protein
MSASEREFLAHHAANYIKATQSIEQMQRLGIVMSGIPIKKQTLRDKQLSVKNFDQCVDIYNQWISDNPNMAQQLTHEQIHNQIEIEQEAWRGQLQLTNATTAAPQLQKPEQ